MPPIGGGVRFPLGSRGSLKVLLGRYKGFYRDAQGLDLGALDSGL